MSMSEENFKKLEQQYLEEKNKIEKFKEQQKTERMDKARKALAELSSDERRIVLNELKEPVYEVEKTKTNVNHAICACHNEHCSGAGCGGWPTLDGQSWVG